MPGTPSKSVWLCVAVLVFGSATCGALAASVRVGMFPYVPNYGSDDHSAMAAYLKTQFQHRHPAAQPIDVTYPTWKELDVYDLDAVAKALSAPLDADGSVQVLEIDALLLGTLVKQHPGVVAEQPGVTACCGAAGGGEGCDFFDIACDAVIVGNKAYATPSWMCSYFIHGATEGACKGDIESSRDSADLISALTQCPAKVQAHLGGVMTGSWTLPTLYLQAYVDTHGPSKLETGLDPTQLDHHVVQSLQSVASLCDRLDSNPCIDGTYKGDATLLVNDMSTGAVAAGLAYSEMRSQFIAKAGADDQFQSLVHAPLGLHRQAPLFFVDGFVVSSVCAKDPECWETAHDFVKFASTDGAADVALGRDRDGVTSPRYLMPSSRKFFKTGEAAGDAFYRQLEAAIVDQNSRAFPNDVMVDSKDALNAAVCRALQLKEPRWKC